MPGQPVQCYFSRSLLNGVGITNELWYAQLLN